MEDSRVDVRVEETKVIVMEKQCKECNYKYVIPIRNVKVDLIETNI